MLFAKNFHGINKLRKGLAMGLAVVFFMQSTSVWASPTEAVDVDNNFIEWMSPARDEQSGQPGQLRGVEPQSAVVVGSNLVNVRRDAGTGYEKLTQLVRYQPVTILGEKTAANNVLWYQIGFTRDGQYQEGYMHSSYLMKTAELVEPDEVDEAFEAEISAFPESYKKILRSLHVMFPNWRFEAVLTGISWERAVEEEYVIKRNLVPDSSAFSWKSVRDGDFDWENGSFISHDGSWVGASKEAIAYYLDPRNFLAPDSRILQFEALNYVEGVQTEAGLANILKGTFMANETYYGYFLNAAASAKVSPYLLASRCLQEVGISGSSTTSGTYPGYEGYYNYFNIGAKANADGTGAVENAMKYAKEAGWDSPEKSIAGGAAILGANYVNKGQNTFYFQKFNVVNGEGGLFSHQYMQNLSAASTEGASLKKTYEDWENSAIAFRIPVYENMPEVPAQLPTQITNNYNDLEGIYLNGKLVNDFMPGQSEYTIETLNGVMKLTGSCPMKGAVVEVPKETYLTAGIYQKEIIVTAVDGSKKTYQVNFDVRSSMKGDVDGDGEVTAKDCQIVLQIDVDLCEMEGTEIDVLDVMRDGQITAADGAVILQYDVGLIDNLD